MKKKDELLGKLREIQPRAGIPIFFSIVPDDPVNELSTVDSDKIVYLEGFESEETITFLNELAAEGKIRYEYPS